MAVPSARIGDIMEPPGRLTGRPRTSARPGPGEFPPVRPSGSEPEREIPVAGTAQHGLDLPGGSDQLSGRARRDPPPGLELNLDDEQVQRLAGQQRVPSGDLTLDAEHAVLHGSQIQVEQRGERANIGYWDRSQDWASWTIRVPAPGTYTLTARCAAATGPTEFVVELDGQALSATVPGTTGWDDYAAVNIGTLAVKSAGTHVLRVRPRDPATWKPMNLLAIRMLQSR